VRRKLGQRGIDGLTARTVEAFLILEQEVSVASGDAGSGDGAAGLPRRRRNV
jgi:hypothetical protein